MTPESVRDIYTVNRGWHRYRWSDTVGWVDEGRTPGTGATWMDGTKSRALDPSFNTPRSQKAPWITPTSQPIGIAMANTVDGDIVPLRSDFLLGSAGLRPNTSQSAVAVGTIKAGDLVYINSAGKVASTPASSSTRKEGKLPKYTSVTTKPSGFTFVVKAKIPHPTLDNLVMIPIEGDLFTVERSDEWKIGDTAMYIAPGTHFCGPTFAEEYFPAVKFLSKGGMGCVNVDTRIFNGVPSRGFLVKPPQRLSPNVTSDYTYDVWCGEQRVAAAKAATEREAKKKEEAARLEILQREAELVGKDAEKRFLARANGTPGFDTIRLVSERGACRLEVDGMDGKWVPLTHIKVKSPDPGDVTIWHSTGKDVVEIARW